MSEVAVTAPSSPAEAPTANAPTLQVRIEPTGPAAERAVAALCVGGAAQRDARAQLGSPAAVGSCSGGEAAVDLLVRAATLALDDTDLHITLQRS